MATQKKHNYVSAGGSTTTPSGKKVKPAKKKGNDAGYRIGAILLWILAIGFEIVAILIFNGTFSLTFMPTLAQLIAALVLDLICVIIGSSLWKTANHINPASEKNKTLFWLWNNMGLIASIAAFFPFVILLLKNKDVDANTKKIAAIVAIVFALIGGIASYDFNPISAEQKQDAIEVYGDTEVYWAPFGKVYHLYEDCGSLNHTDTLTVGTVEEAIEAGRTRVCKHCDNRNEAAWDNLENREVDEAE